MKTLNIELTGETSRNILIKLANSTNARKVLVNKDWIKEYNNDTVTFKDQLFCMTVLKAFN